MKTDKMLQVQILDDYVTNWEHVTIPAPYDEENEKTH